MQKNKKYLLTMLTFAFVIACIFFFQKDVKAAEKTGTVTFSIERFTIGQGYLIEPCQVDIYDTDNIASVVDRVLTQEGYGYENKGKIQDGFYLEQIYNGDTGKVRIPSIISDGQLQPIKNNAGDLIPIPTNAVNDGNDYGNESGHFALGEFAYCNMSGWMYTVNNVFPTGMSLVKPKDGDIIRLQFTLYGYGRDLGEKPADEEDNNYLKLPDRDAITKRLAVMLKYKASCDEHGYKQAYQKAYNAVIDWNTTEKKMKEVVYQYLRLFFSKDDPNIFLDRTKKNNMLDDFFVVFGKFIPINIIQNNGLASNIDFINDLDSDMKEKIILETAIFYNERGQNK